MNNNTLKKYLLNCFVLTTPVLVWNIAWIHKLPKDFQADVFWHQIPSIIAYGENIFRLIIFVLASLMPISLSTSLQKKGFLLYLIGLFLYFMSWLILIYFPNSAWSHSVLGFLSPAYTPLLWLLGIGLIGNSYYLNLPYRKWFFILVAILFLIFHNFHTYIIYLRNH